MPPKLYPYNLNTVTKDYTEDDIRIRRENLSVLNLLLSRHDEAIKFIIFIAWILFKIHGLLDPDEFARLKIYEGELDNLPWHSDNPIERIKWIPQVFLLMAHKKSLFLIAKLKSYLNFFFVITFKSPFYSVERVKGKGIGIFSRLQSDFEIRDIFGLCTMFSINNRHVTIILRCSEKMFTKLNDFNYQSIFMFDGRFYAMAGPVTLAIVQQTMQQIIRLARLRCFNANRFNFPSEDWLFYSFQRNLYTFQENKFEGFGDHGARCSISDHYSIGEVITKVTRLFKKIDEEVDSSDDESCCSLRCKLDNNFAPGQLYRITETYKGCVFDDFEMNKSMKKIGYKEQIIFRFIVEENEVEKKHEGREDDQPPNNNKDKEAHNNNNINK